MNSKTIVRIEHPKDGLGVFRSRQLPPSDDYTLIELHSRHDEIVDRHSDIDKFPTYNDDGQLRNQMDNQTNVLLYHFAFNSLEQFNTAFTKEEVKEFIAQLGFQVLTLEVTEWFSSDYQTVYKKDSVLSQTDISSLFL